MLERRLGPVTMTGRVIDVDLLDRGWRVVIVPDPLPGLAATEQPRRVRLHIAPSSDELRPGDRLQVKAMLFPVPGQVLPGGRDMQRELYSPVSAASATAMAARAASQHPRKRAAQAAGANGSCNCATR
jgi:hypothetical protein